MNNTFLTKKLSSFSVCDSKISYIFPTVNNLKPGFYDSEIIDVKEVFFDDSKFEAIDFFHKLTDGSGNDIYVRFRYYEKELYNLALKLRQYPSIEAFEDAIGLCEKVTITAKATGNYMRISTRSLSTPAVDDTPPSKPKGIMSSKRGGLLAHSKRGHSTHTVTSEQRAALVNNTDNDDDDEFNYFLEDEYDDN